MATILQYQNGKMIPVNVDNEILHNGLSEMTSSPSGTFYRKSKMAKKSSMFYGSLLGVLITANLTLLAMAIELI